MIHVHKGRTIRACLLVCGMVLFALSATVLASPEPGDVFREYYWTNKDGDADGTLRVGGKLDYGGGPIELPHNLDLKHATRAEVIVEKLLCHAGTRGLAISVNGHGWTEIPEAEAIAKPPWKYQHHTYPTVPVPLQQLNHGEGNDFRMKVNDEHPWDWPQNLIYGVHIRIYYNSRKKAHPGGRMISPSDNAELGKKVSLQADASSPHGEIQRVDFMGRFRGVDLDGDGQYTEWHYHYLKGKLAGHIGTARKAPWQVTWNTAWVPDQPQPISLAARITDESGLTYLTHRAEGLKLQREDFSVELCEPYDIPQEWVTRSAKHEENFRVHGDPSGATSARLVWRSWSPGYMEGIYINGQKVFHREGPRYAYYLHRVPLQDLSVLKPGKNILATGKTPKYDGQTVHGMEVNWPGIMVLIRYSR